MLKTPLKTQDGFTLIETLIYIGLFALIMTSILLATHQLIASTDKTQVRAHVEGEAQFVLSKLDEVLNGASVVAESGGVLTVTNLTLPSAENPLKISRDNATNTVMLQRGSASANKLNGAIAPITRLNFIIGTVGTQTTLTTTFVVTTPLLTAPLTFTSTRTIRK